MLDDLVAPVVLRDVVLGGDATGSDTAAAGLGLSGLLDLRSWPSDALDAACELALVRGVPCRPCPDAPDGPAACVQLDARAMIGAAHGALEEPSSACVGG